MMVTGEIEQSVGIIPAVDAFLAYQAQAANKVVFKHIATAVFLIVTFTVLNTLGKRSKVCGIICFGKDNMIYKSA
jgi:hypothetical protein